MGYINCGRETVLRPVLFTLFSVKFSEKPWRAHQEMSRQIFREKHLRMWPMLLQVDKCNGNKTTNDVSGLNIRLYVTRFSSIPYCRISEITFSFKNVTNIQSSWRLLLGNFLGLIFEILIFSGTIIFSELFFYELVR